MAGNQIITMREKDVSRRWTTHYTRC